MNKNKNFQDNFEILRQISKFPKYSQRDLAGRLGFSIGKVNYCLKNLKKKGLVKVKNLSKKKEKVKYLRKYVLTKQGVLLRTKLTIDFMKKKMVEYDELKKEIKL